MARNASTITVAYLTALVGFVTRLERHQKKALEVPQDKLPEFRGVTISIESGNKYDKVLRSVTRARQANPEKSRTTTEVLYFVEKATGEVYGARSEIAPNLTRYFGKVENASKWNWSGDTAVNVSDDSVEEVGEYGDTKHYALIKAKKNSPVAELGNAVLDIADSLTA
jgi:hypothetical protein